MYPSRRWLDDRAVVAVWLLFCSLPVAQADDRPDSIRSSQSPARRALVICGLAGDDEYLQQFTESIATIRSVLTKKLGFEERNVRIHFGRAEHVDPVAAFPTVGRATREELAEEASQLASQVKQQDETWVFIFGHSYFDGRRVFLNIPEADITHEQFANLFDELGGRSCFFVCTPVSGFYIKHLSQKGRVVITSSEAGWETNGSMFHLALAEAMEEAKPETTFDLDHNGTLSLLDLYLRTNQILADLYVENEPALIPTEHPQLDDDGDGRGSELQVDYLTMAQGGRSDSKRRRRIRKFRDGAVAANRGLGFSSPEEDDPK